MHQFLLYGNLPHSRHEQVLNIFAGVCATQPTAYAEQHVFQPPIVPPINGDLVNLKKKPAAVSQMYWRDVVRDLDVVTLSPTGPWTVTVREEPEAGSPLLISQPYKEQGPLADQDSVNAAAYSVHSGHFFVHGNVVLKIFQLLGPKSKDSAKPLSKDSLRLLDSSGTWLIEASVRLEDRKNTQLAEEASRELLEMKRMLQSAVPLTVPERLALDTRFDPRQMQTAGA